MVKIAMNLNCSSQFVANYQKYIFHEYRQKLLEIFLKASVWVTLFLLIVNLVEWYIDPITPWRVQNVVADLFTMVLLAVFLWINRQGWTVFSAWGILLMAIAVVYQSYSPEHLTSSIVLVTLPIVLSSFLIRPAASFLFMAVAIVFYLLVYLTNPDEVAIDLFASLVLPVLAGGSYYVALLLNQTIAELVVAYDETIQGWATALEMRDSETQGHSARVCELTITLARRMNVPERELIHLRRGVLLHDIGKMAIPDAILHKPGPLTEEEWQVMRRHPEYARTYLIKVPFLGPALDIPYFHHERWDGSGYPNGLAGENIPFYARLFAVVDVWDALTSDRPYRGAWPPEKTLAYLQAESGKQFDPRVVSAFIEMLQTPSPSPAE